MGISPIGALLAWKIQTFLSIVFALCVAIIVEFGGMGRLWEAHDGSRLQNRTAEEYELLAARSCNGLAVQTVDKVRLLYLGLVDLVFGSSRAEWEMRSKRPAGSPESMSLPVRFLDDMHRAISRHSHTTASLLREISFRVAAMTVGWAVMAFFFAIGLTDGLVRREIRRWSGGRESSWVYNTSSRLLGPISLVYTVTLIAWPWTLDIAWTISIFALINGLALSIASSRFKKYL